MEATVHLPSRITVATAAGVEAGVRVLVAATARVLEVAGRSFALAGFAGSPAPQAQPGPLRQVDEAEMHESPHAFPFVHTLQQARPFTVTEAAHGRLRSALAAPPRKRSGTRSTLRIVVRIMEIARERSAGKGAGAYGPDCKSYG
jgi:hypothetical protein